MSDYFLSYAKKTFRGTAAASWPRTSGPCDPVRYLSDFLKFQSPPRRGSNCCVPLPAKGSSTIPSKFQSPPRRGSNCCFPTMPRSPTRICYFSPLLVGDLTAARERCGRRRGSGLTFQSPPRRGSNCCFALEIVASRYASTHFSPLLVGDLTAAGGIAGVLAKAFGLFQSPPRRGSNCCNRFRCRMCGRSNGFQSPPRRGSNCCVDGPCGFPPAIRHFSPLLVGDLTAASRLKPSCSSPLAYFSPLLVGDLTAAAIPRRRRSPIYSHFSPLLVGDLTAARDSRFAAQGISAFQSPPRRGSNCCAAALRVRRIGRAAFQSPPRRGSNCCGNRTRGARRTCSHFSPLLVGDLTAAERQETSPPPGSSFQSPPRRGSNCCSRPAQSPHQQGSPISVPSSSGI